MCQKKFFSLRIVEGQPKVSALNVYEEHVFFVWGICAKYCYFNYYSILDSLSTCYCLYEYE